MRTISPRSFLSVALWSLFVAVMAVTFSGCSIFGGGGGDGNPIAADAVSVRSVTGRILAPVDAPQNIVSGSLRASTAGRAGIRVAIEEIPTIFDDTDENGTYVLENVPPGTWHVVAWLEPATGKPYRVRSVTITADTSSSVPITVADLELVITSRVVNGKLVNSAGAVLPFGTKMWLWGKEFTLQTGGLFTTPFLPETASQAEILVATTTTTRAFRFTAPFVSGDAPATLLIVVPGLDGSANQAPVVTLEAKVGNEVTTKVLQGGTVTLQAAATDAETTNPSNLNVSWVVTKGTLTISPTDKYAATWVAPDKDGVATITVRVNDGQATSSVSLPILVNITTPTQVTDQIPPAVSTIIPADAATAIATNTTIVLTFNEAIDPSTLTAEDLVIFPGTGLDMLDNVKSSIRPLVDDFITGTIVFSDGNKTVTFTPASPLAHGTDYTVSLFAGVQDVEGNPIADDQDWTFTTVEAPAVTTVSPLNASVNQATSSKITVTFNKAMNTGTFAITVKDNDNTTINGTIAANGDTGFTFTPNPALVFGKTYSVTIPKTVSDTLGNSLLAPYSFSFLTGNPPTASFSVAGGAVKVSMQEPLVITFSQAMDTNTLTYGSGNTINLTQAGVSVAGTVAFGVAAGGGTTVTIQPTAALSPSLPYVLTITTAAKNSIGEVLQANFTSSFTTQGPAPTVTLVTPATTTNVRTDTSINIQFDKAMDPTTITETTITLLANGAIVPWTLVNYNAATFAATFKPDSNLANSTLFTISISTNVRANDGGSFVSPVTFMTFTTAAKFTPPPQGAATSAGNAISAVDGAGNIFVAGYTLDGSSGKVYLLKYLPAGGAPELFTVTSTGDSRATGIVIDGAGDVYICGYTSGSFEGGTNIGRYDFFVAKYNGSTKALVWSKQIGSSENDRAYGIAFFAGNVYVTGSSSKLSPSSMLDGATVLNLAGGPNPDSPCFVLRLNSTTGVIDNGTGTYGLGFLGINGINIGNAVAVNGTGVFVVGTSYGNAVVGSVNPGGTDVFVARLNSPDMTPIQVVQHNSPGFDWGTGCALYGANIFISGYSDGTTFGCSGQLNDGFVVQLIQGNFVFGPAPTFAVTTSGDDICTGVGVDSPGNVYLSGHTTGAITGTSAGGRDVFVTKLTAALIETSEPATWRRQIGTTVNDVATGLTMDAANNFVFLTGWSEGDIDISGTTTNQSKVFLLKYDDTGYKY